MRPYLSILILLPMFFLGAHAVFAIAPGQPCVGTVDQNECDGAYVCIGGKCVVDPSLTPVTGGTSSGGYTSPGTGTGTGAPGGFTSPGTGVGAPTGGLSGGSPLTNPLNATSLQMLIEEILKYAVMLGTIFLTVMILYVGFQFVNAKGEPGKLTKAREALLWTVVGGLLLLGAQALAMVIAATVQAL